jgi:hypothetical protein
LTPVSRSTLRSRRTAQVIGKGERERGRGTCLLSPSGANEHGAFRIVCVSIVLPLPCICRPRDARVRTLFQMRVHQTREGLVDDPGDAVPISVSRAKDHKHGQDLMPDDVGSLSSGSSLKTGPALAEPALASLEFSFQGSRDRPCLWIVLSNHLLSCLRHSGLRTLVLDGRLSMMRLLPLRTSAT